VVSRKPFFSFPPTPAWMDSAPCQRARAAVRYDAAKTAQEAGDDFGWWRNTVEADRLMNAAAKQSNEMPREIR